MTKLKRNYIQLVENPKAEEIKMETFLTPHFIPLDVLYEATDIMAELEQVETGEVEMSFKEQLDKLIDVVVKIYGKQFTAKDVKARLHAPDAIQALQRQVEFIANGQQDEETKKFIQSIS
ncbi:phage tail assembly chaperone G [Staphylococcus simulans]|uniref:phage tail assembly chaperone G n=1 Tax=Staphylococcus simulans TaxID=1286 RepID=UPI00399AA77D